MGWASLWALWGTCLHAPSLRVPCPDPEHLLQTLQSKPWDSPPTGMAFGQDQGLTCRPRTLLSLTPTWRKPTSTLLCVSSQLPQPFLSHSWCSSTGWPVPSQRAKGLLPAQALCVPSTVLVRGGDPKVRYSDPQAARFTHRLQGTYLQILRDMDVTLGVACPLSAPRPTSSTWTLMQGPHSSMQMSPWFRSTPRGFPSPGTSTGE